MKPTTFLASAGLLSLALSGTLAAADEPQKPKSEPDVTRARELLERYQKEMDIQEIKAKKLTDNLDAQVIWMLANQGAFGVTVTQADDTLRSQLELPNDRGLVVTGVAPNSPAAKAGVQAKDILMQLANKPLGTPEDLNKLYKAVDGAHALELSLIRAGKPMTVKVEPNKPREEVTRAEHDLAALAELEKRRNEQPAYRIGIALSAVDETLRAHLGLPDGQGLVVEQVMAKSPAERAGVKVNDVLTKLGEEDVVKIEQVVDKIRGSEGKDLTLALLRHGKPVNVTVTPEKSVIETEHTQTLEGATDSGTKPEYRLEFVRPGVMLGTKPAEKVLIQPVPVGRTTEVLTRPQDLSRLEHKLDEVIRELKAMRHDNDLDSLRKEVKALRDSYEKLESSKK